MCTLCICGHVKSLNVMQIAGSLHSISNSIHATVHAMVPEHLHKLAEVNVYDR